MTLQETFDAAVGGILAQGKPAYSLDHGCRYRMPDGCKCAAGQLIADEKYDPVFEGRGVSTLMSTNLDSSRAMLVNATAPETRELWTNKSRDDLEKDVRQLEALLGALEGHDLELVAAIQHAHDQNARVYSKDITASRFIANFKTEASGIAKRFDLSTRVIDEHLAAKIGATP